MHETAAEAITKLIYTYAERIDAGDFAGVGELFAHATLTFEGFGDAVSGREAIEALYAAHHAPLRGRDPADQARHDQRDGRRGRRRRDGTSRSYFTVLQAVPGALALQPVIAGRYRHAYEQVEGRWRVTAMHITIDLVGDLGHHMLFDLAP